MKKYHFIGQKNRIPFQSDFTFSMVYHIEIVSIVVEYDTNVITFHILEVFLQFLVLILSRTVSLLTVPSVAQKFVFFL